MSTTATDWTYIKLFAAVTENAATLARILVRPHDGGIESSDVAFTAIAIGVDHEFHSFSGRGALRYVTFMVNSGTDSHKAIPEIVIDGTTVHPHEQFQAFNARGYDAITRPIQLTKYAVNDIIHGIWYFDPPMVFDTSLSIKCTNGSATDSISVLCSWFYQALPA